MLERSGASSRPNRRIRDHNTKLSVVAPPSLTTSLLESLVAVGIQKIPGLAIHVYDDCCGHDWMISPADRSIVLNGGLHPLDAAGALQEAITALELRLANADPTPLWPVPGLIDELAERRQQHLRRRTS